MGTPVSSVTGDIAVDLMGLIVGKQLGWIVHPQLRAGTGIAISLTKRLLLASTASERSRPNGATRWDVNRTPRREFVGYIEQTA